MKLSDQEYAKLKQDLQISQAIDMIKSALVDDKKERTKKEQGYYIGHAEYLSETINTFENLINDSTAMDLLKIDKYLQFYLNELRKSGYAAPEALSAIEKLKNDSSLKNSLDFSINLYIQYQINQLKKSKIPLLKSKPKRIGPYIDINRQLKKIILKLKSKGIKKISDTIDFIFRLYQEYDVLDLEDRIDDEVKNYKKYKFEARTEGSYNVERVLRDDPGLAKEIIDEYDPEIEIKKEYDDNIADIKSNIRKIVKSVLTD